ncbi:MAG TPA: glycogen synthase GlgA [Anaeromyxobacteraceae bacterium]|nr:glycogen synthase GlgA [Anaeromyxobacteraceae bacterium]
MEILFVASEVAPWSKTGGLGDVAGALPKALAARGHAVAVVAPRYGFVDAGRAGFEARHRAVRVRGEPTTVHVKAHGRVTHYLVEHEHLFGSRRGLYGEHGHDYGDNAERFAWFCRAALEVPSAFGHRPRVLHLNDWQTGLAAWLLRREHAQDPALANARSVFTIHNLAYQGVFRKELLPAIGLPWDVFRFDAMEFHDQLNFMKAGLVYADAITTVSPTYAKEITTPEGGEGLDGLLRLRQRDLTGIVNGIDVHEWDPSTDKHLPHHYDLHHLAGKHACKRALQEEVGLPARGDVPLVGLVGRLADQKGMDLVLAALPELLRRDVQVVLLGSGRHDWEQAFAEAARRHPQKLAARIGFDEGLAHRIEAGADAFLMPSRFEPCGLNQLYSLRYGTVPVVRKVGGLADTVEDYDGWRRGTGFSFGPYDHRAMLLALKRAKELYRDRKAWTAMIRRGMAQDHSWAKSAASYEALYERLHR